VRKAVVFDMDGVLVSTDQLHYQSWQLLAERCRVPFAWETFDLRMRGLERPHAAKVFLRETGQGTDDALATRLAAEKQTLFLDLLQNTPPQVADGVVSLLRELSQRGIPMAVGSSSRNALLVLERLELSRSFGAIVGGGTLPGKPSPAIFLEAARQLGVEPADCVVLEDAVDGVRAGAAAGMKIVAIGPAERFQGLPVDWRVDRFAEITADRLLAL
jgi:beta-phosphoglucomutase